MFTNECGPRLHTSLFDSKVPLPRYLYTFDIVTALAASLDTGSFLIPLFCKLSLHVSPKSRMDDIMSFSASRIPFSSKCSVCSRAIICLAWLSLPLQYALIWPWSSDKCRLLHILSACNHLQCNVLATRHLQDTFKLERQPFHTLQAKPAQFITRNTCIIQAALHEPTYCNIFSQM